MDSSQPFEEFISLEPHVEYELVMRNGNTLTGTIVSSEDDWFYIKIGKTTRQFYYWDVHYGYPMEQPNE